MAEAPTLPQYALRLRQTPEELSWSPEQLTRRINAAWHDLGTAPRGTGVHEKTTYGCGRRTHPADSCWCPPPRDLTYRESPTCRHA